MKWTAFENATQESLDQPTLPGLHDGSIESCSEENAPSGDSMQTLFYLLPQFDLPAQNSAGQLAVSLNEYRKDAKKRIENHLKSFSKGQKSYKDLDVSIQAICEYGSHLLLDTPPIWGYTRLNEARTDGERTLLQHQISKTNRIDQNRIFQKRWLTNIPRLLPHDNEVMKILPYLITCYTITASENRLDPFDDAQHTACTGWRSIFVELIDKNSPSEINLPDPSSRAKSIRSLCNRFLTIHRRKGTSYKKRTAVEAEEMVRHACASFWEHYQRFASFCLACRQKREVNITLSTALFWDAQKRNLFVETYCPRQVWEDPEMRQYIPCQYTMAGIISDIARDKILALFDGHDGANTLNIHEIAYYLNLDDIEDMRSKENTVFWDELEVYDE